MTIIDRSATSLLLIDFQTRLMAAIHEAGAVIGNARRLVDAAVLLEIPVVATEQNPKGLGPTVDALLRPGLPVIDKMEFDATKASAFAAGMPAGRQQIVVAGCEAHVCVLQTVLGLLEQGKRVFVVRDAVGSRRPDSRDAGLARMERHGAEIVTTEMAVFEWLGSAGHPKFREVIALIK